MRLNWALAISLIRTTGVPGPEIGAAWTKALAIAECLDDAEYQLRSLWGLWTFHIGRSPYDVVLQLAGKFPQSRGEPAPLERIADWRPNDGVSQHLYGEQASARRNMEHFLVHFVPRVQHSHAMPFQADQRVIANVFLARILWLQGLSDQAMQMAKSSVEEARAASHIISEGYALAMAACPIAAYRRPYRRS